MANILKTVKSSGGDYTSLAGLEAGQQQNLTDGGGDTFEGVLYALIDTAAVDFDGWTTAAGNYIYIHTDATARHAGKWDAAKYNLSITAAANGAYCLNDVEEFVRFDGLQIKLIGGAYTGCNAIGFGTGTTSDLRISNCIIINNSHHCINIGGGVINIWNTICYGGALYGIRGSATGAGVQIYSSTMIGVNSGIRANDGTWVAKNCYARGDGIAAYYGTMTMATCASHDTSGSVGLQGILESTTADSTHAGFTNISAGTEDYHIKTSSPLIGVGTDTSGDAAPMNFTTDIDGDTRSGTWDIGADEYAAGGSTYNESIALSASAAVAQAGAGDLLGSLSLPASAALTPGGVMDMLASLALSAAANWDGIGGLDLNDGISLAASALISPAVLLELNESLALTAGAALTPSALLDAVGDLILLASAGIIPAGNVDMYASLVLAAVAAWASSGGASFDEAITLSAAASIAESFLLEINESIGLSANAGLAVEGVMDLLAELGLPASCVISPAAGFEIVADLVLAAVSTMAVAGDIEAAKKLSVGIRTAGAGMDRRAPGGLGRSAPGAQRRDA